MISEQRLDGLGVGVPRGATAAVARLGIGGAILRVTAATNRHAGLVIFVLALVARLAWVLTLDNRLSWIDEEEYATVARHLARGDGYVSSSYRANPIVPYYLSLAFRVFGEEYAAARVGQAVLGALACVIIYRIGAILLGTGAGVLAGLLLAAYPPHIYVAGVFYVDSWLTVLCAVSFYLAILTQQAGGRVGLAFLCGVSLGLTALTRGNFLACVPAVGIAWIYSGRCGRRMLSACAALVAGCALTILPWTLRNYGAYGRPILISSGLYTTLWRGNNVLADGGADDRHLMWYSPMWQERLEHLPDEERRAIAARYEIVDRQVLEEYRRLGDEYLATDAVLKPLVVESMSDPLRMTVLMARKVRTLFSAFSDTETQNAHTSRRNQWVAAVTFYPVLLLALGGAWLGWPRCRELALLYLVVLSMVASYALLTVCTRFRLPLDPYRILFASLTLARLAQLAGWGGPAVHDRLDHRAVARAERTFQDGASAGGRRDA